MTHRSFFPHAVLYVKVEGLTTLGEILTALRHAMARWPEGPTGGRRGPDADDAAPSNGLAHDEAWVLKQLIGKKTVVVLDHVEDCSSGDIRVFLGQLFDQSSAGVRVLLTSTRPMGLQSATEVGVVESVVALGPLTFKNAARLFARQCPHLRTAAERRSFLKRLVPRNQANLTVYSQDITPASVRILAETLGQGFPARIVCLAYELDKAGFRRLIYQHTAGHGLEAIGEGVEVEEPGGNARTGGGGGGGDAGEVPH